MAPSPTTVLEINNDVTGRRVRGSFVGLLDSATVRVVYSDESGVGGSVEKEPITVITAVMLNMESHWAPLETDMSQIAYAGPKKALRHGSEFHGRRLLQQARSGKNHADEILHKLLDAVVRHRVHVFAGAVDRVGLHNYQSPQAEKKTDRTVAFETCLRNVETYVHTIVPNERLLWIADRNSYERELKTGLTRFRHHQSFGRLFRDDERTDPTHVVDTMYFGDSAESLALQLADICSSVVTLGLKGKYYANPRCSSPYFEKILPQIVAGHGPPRFMFYRRPRRAGEPSDDEMP